MEEFNIPEGMALVNKADCLQSIATSKRYEDALFAIQGISVSYWSAKSAINTIRAIAQNAIIPNYNPSRDSDV